jgi:mono/diheme cytochrome c family protein
MSNILTNPLYNRSSAHWKAIVVRLLAVLLLVWGTVRFAQDWQRTVPLAPVELTLYAYLPDNGGWVGELLQVESGRDVRLAVNTVEGAHRLRIAHTEIESDLLVPGLPHVIEFTAPEPGRYVLYCTLWCGANHWRMRTVLEVIDPASPGAPVHYAQDPLRYPLAVNQLDIDAPHTAEAWPTEPMDSALGASVWQGIESEIAPADVLAELGWPLISPSDAYLALQDGRVIPHGIDASEAERWALLAFLWESQATPDVLERGAAIYAENCASCHAVDGSGSGFAAYESPAVEPDLRYAPTAAGASPIQYYAKTARGGMGTGMPNWGTVLGEDDLWAVTEYLYTFFFRSNHADPELLPAEMGEGHGH